MRPAEISDGVSLSDKLGRLVAALVSEYRAINSFLAAVVHEVSPDKQRIAFPRSEDDVFAGSDELRDLALSVAALR
jgi:hypothetical protein